MKVWIDGIGVIAPGLPNWPAATDVLSGNSPYVTAPSLLPAPALLPPAERRRASRMVKLTLGIGLEAAAMAARDAGSLMTVFASSSGDGANCNAICEQLATDDRMISPTRFTNSVHNVAAGFWGIATGATAPCQVICAYDASFAAGLLEAATQTICAQQPVLLLAYEVEYGGPLRAMRPIPDAAGVALVLSPTQGTHSRAQLGLALGETSPTRLDDAALDVLQQAIPALRGLPLLQALAMRRATTVSLDYLAPLQLDATVTPC